MMWNFYLCEGLNLFKAEKQTGAVGRLFFYYKTGTNRAQKRFNRYHLLLYIYIPLAGGEFSLGEKKPAEGGQGNNGNWVETPFDQ